MSDLSHTFFAALRSIATAATLASSGFYLHRRKLITAEGRKALAIVSQQVAIPALFFSKIIYCPQDFKEEECPNVLEHLSDVWILLLWPFYVVGCGLLVGEAAAILSFTPLCHRKLVRVACGFANSTGLPLTLIAVLYANFPGTDHKRVDPSIFLSIYVSMYQILQWGVGGWLLAEPKNESTDNSTQRRGVHHVLNAVHHDSLSSATTAIAEDIHPEATRRMSNTQHGAQRQTELKTERRLSASASDESEGDDLEQTVSLIQFHNSNNSEDAIQTISDEVYVPSDVAPLAVTIYNVLSEALQPPVVGALLGIFVAAIRPLRALFVDMRDRDDDAPLQWLFDGIYVIGHAAVPLNMCILGISLSSSLEATKAKDLVSVPTIMAVVVGKLIVMPMIGILTTLVLKKYLWTMPDSISASLYLVLMVVTITPTANNVIVMVELSGSSIKEAMARTIAWEYAVTPVILSITVMLIVKVAYQ